MLLMIIGDFDPMRVAIFPSETHAPLIIDADAVLAFAIAPKLFETIARNRLKVLETSSGMEGK